MYIDPAVGSLVLQAIAAAALSALAMIGRVRDFIKAVFKSILPKRPTR